MTPQVQAWTTQDEKVLLWAIQCKRPVVITHHCPAGWRSFRSQFVDVTGENRIRIRFPRWTAGTRQVPLAQGDRIGVSFRTGHKKCSFTTVISSKPQNASGVDLIWPAELHWFRRRAFERVTPPPLKTVAVRFWEYQAEADPHARNVRHGQLIDLSLGGMRIKTANLHYLDHERTYRCAFTPFQNRAGILLDALVLHREAETEHPGAVGFQFIGQEVTPEGREMMIRLAAVVATFQRANARSRRRA